MELRQLRHFVAIADTLHYRRAAKRLSITQPSLSQSIRRLEQSMGIELLDRTRRRVMLTDAGRALLGEARELLARAELAQRVVQRASTEPREITIGFIQTALYRVLPAALLRFQKIWPAVVIRTIELPSGEQLARLRAGSLDFGFVMLGVGEDKDLVSRVVESAPLCVAVSAHSPLARRKSVSLADLADEPFVAAARETNPAVHALVGDIWRRAGFNPRIVQYSGHTFTSLKLVAGGMGVSLVPGMARDMRVEGVTFLALADPGPPLLRLAITWIDRPLSAPAAAMVKIVEQLSVPGGREAAAASQRRPRKVSP